MHSVSLRERRPLLGLWRLLTDRRIVFFSALLFQGMAVSTETAGHLVLRFFVDRMSSGGSLLLPIGLIASSYVALAAVRGFFSFLSGRAAAGTAEGIAKAVRDTLFDHIQRLPFTYHDRTQTGELIQRVSSDVDSVRRFYGDQVVGISRIAFLFLINFITILTINVRLALMSTLIVPLIIAVSIAFFNRISKAYDAYQDQDARVSSILQENLSGVRVVKAFARAEFEIRKFDEVSRGRLLSGKKLLANHALYWPVSHLICAAQTLLGWSMGAFMVLDGSLSIGTYLAYTAMLGGLIWPLQQLGRLISQLSTSTVSYSRLAEIMREEPEAMGPALITPARGHDRPDERAERPRGHIVFDGVWFAYLADQWALCDISFEALPGQKIALIGEPGSGKSSLVNLLPRFYDYNRGRILLDGRPLESYSRSFLRSAIGIVEQQPFLFSMSISENIAYGSRETVATESIRTAAEAAAVHDAVAGFPQGYDTLVGERGVTLSGGQKQRLAIARTLVKDPALLILDDSTSSVDAETEEDIRAALATLMRGRTTFIIAHKIQSLMDADLILVFKGGRIIERGDHRELLARDGFYRQVYDLQTSIERDLEKELNHERTS